MRPGKLQMVLLVLVLLCLLHLDSLALRSLPLTTADQLDGPRSVIKKGGGGGGGRGGGGGGRGGSSGGGGRGGGRGKEGGYAGRVIPVYGAGSLPHRQDNNGHHHNGATRSGHGNFYSGRCSLLIVSVATFLLMHA